MHYRIFPQKIRVVPEEKWDTLSQELFIPDFLEYEGVSREYRAIREKHFIMTPNFSRLLEGTRLKSRRRRTKLPSILREIDYSTRQIFSQYFTHYHSTDYSDDVLLKIKETLIDLKWLGMVYGVEEEELSKFFAIVRLLNEAVYAADEWFEGKSKYISLEGFKRRGVMFYRAALLLHKFGKEGLIPELSQFLTALDANFLSELLVQEIELEGELKRARVFVDVFKPSENTHMDTGYYGELFAKWFRMKGRGSFCSLWNNSRRVTDIIDGLLDLREDVRSNTFSPLTLYVISVCRNDERRMIKDRILQGIYTPRLRSVISKYSKELIEDLQEYMQRVHTPNKKLKMVKERMLKIAELGIAVCENEDAESNYFDFYSTLNV